MSTESDTSTSFLKSLHERNILRPSQGFGGTGSYISGEQRNRSLKVKGTGEQRQFGGIGNIKNQDFDFGEQRKMPIFFQGNKRTGTTPPKGASILLQEKDQESS